MSKLFRLSTFNCQNLYSRARILGLADHEQVAALMEQAGELEALLARRRPAAAELQRIGVLRQSLSRYVEITAAGLHFRRGALGESRRALKAKVVRCVDAHVQCLVEVDDRQALEAFNHHALRGHFAHQVLIGGPDPRGIDLGLVSQRPIRSLRCHRLDGDGHGPPFARDGLEVEIDLPGGGSLHLLLNHFKSRGHGDPRATDARRRHQAAAVARTLAERFDLTRDLVAVLGDFGDSPQRAPQCLAPLLQAPGLNDALALQLPIPDDRWTVHHQRNEQVDYILVSEALRRHLRDAGIERRGMPDLELHTISREKPFSETRGGCAASLHGAVWADFEL